MSSWVRVETRFVNHPKVLDIGPLGEALWLRGLCYAGEQLTDGFVPDSYIKRMGDMKGPTIAARLVEAGLWDQVDGGYQIHDYFHRYEIGDLNQIERRTPAYRVWRDAVLCRDGYACQECGQTDGELHAHHISSWATHREIRFDVANGMTLCKLCHIAVHTKAVD